MPFRNLMGRVLKGEPVGHATKDVSDLVSASLPLQNAIGPQTCRRPPARPS